MPTRRRFLSSIGVGSVVLFSGCSVLGPTSSAGPVEPQETTPEPAQGDRLTVSRDVSSMAATMLENGSVDGGGSNGVEPFSSGAASRSVDLARDAVRDHLANRLPKPDDAVKWELVWDGDRDRFLVVTTMTVDPPVDAVHWPSRFYDEIRSTAPKSVTVILSASGRTASNEFPVYARAKLRSTSESPRRP